jgi:hypothetical protein
MFCPDNLKFELQFVRTLTNLEKIGEGKLIIEYLHKDVYS